MATREEVLRCYSVVLDNLDKLDALEIREIEDALEEHELSLMPPIPTNWESREKP